MRELPIGTTACAASERGASPRDGEQGGFFVINLQERGCAGQRGALDVRGAKGEDTFDGRWQIGHIIWVHY